MKPEYRSLAVILVTFAVGIAGVAVEFLVLPSEAARGALPIPSGTVMGLSPTHGLFAVEFDFSWGSGAHLQGSWVASTNTSVSVGPRLTCTFCPLMRIDFVHGTEGTFNETFGGPGQDYSNMSIAFTSRLPDAILIVQTVEVRYPPVTAILPAGTVLSGTGLQVYTFNVSAPGAFLVGASTSINTSLWIYSNSTVQEPSNCAPWPPNTPPFVYKDTYNAYLTPGSYAIGSGICSTRPWTITVTQTVGIFYF